jgi:integrase
MARRRGQRKGYLRAENGSWLLTYRIYEWDLEQKKTVPKRLTVTIGPAAGSGKLTKKQAERFSHDHYLEPLDKTVLHPRSTLTLKQFWEKSFEPHKITRKALKLATRMQYTSLWNSWIKPILGDVKLCEFQPDHAQTLVDRILAAGRSTKTANSARIAASSIFTYAKKLRAASGDNPFGLVEMPEAQPVRPARALTWEQCKSLLPLLPETVKEMALCAITLSMNVSELRGLKWKHINLSTEWVPLAGTDVIPPLMIAVREHYYYRERGTLKTANRRRNLPMPGAVQAALAQLRARSQFGSPEDSVFANQAGKPISDNNVVKRVFAKLPVELNWVTWHMFRHTHATLTKMQGASSHDRRALTGHGSFEMLDHYTHSDYDRMREIVESIAQRITDQQLTSNDMKGADSKWAVQ